MAKQLKLTKAIKTKWLKALKSGKYKRYTGVICNPTRTRFCCIGVLVNILSEQLTFDRKEWDLNPNKSPYHYLKQRIGEMRLVDIWIANDSIDIEESDGYEMVIPLIEKL